MVEKDKIQIEKIAKQCAKDYSILKNKGVDVSCGFEIYKHDSNMTMQKFVDNIDQLMYAEKQIHHCK